MGGSPLNLPPPAPPEQAKGLGEEQGGLYGSPSLGALGMLHLQRGVWREKGIGGDMGGYPSMVTESIFLLMGG